MSGRTARLVLILLLVQFCCISTALAQNGPMVSIGPGVRSEPVANYAAYPHADLRVDVPLILIPVHVTTPLGTSVTDLRQENFRVFEDGVEQPLTSFAKEDAPVSIGMVFDSSGSMHTKIHKSAEAAAAFFRVANPEDEFFLVEFNDRPKLSVPFTHDSDEISQRIGRVRAAGRTSLLDAI